MENNALLDTFAAAGITDFSDYHRRAAVWSKLPASSHNRFVRSTAIGWLRSFLKSPADNSSPEPVLLQALFGPELAGQRFASASKNLIKSGLSFFRLFVNAPEDMFQEWLTTVVTGSEQLSLGQREAILQLINLRKWQNSLITIQKLARDSRRRDFEALWDAYWGALSWQEKVLRRLDTLFSKSENIALIPSSIMDYSTKHSSKEKTVALFMTALGLEFNAVLSQLRNVKEKTADGVVYAVGSFEVEGVEFPVAVAQTGAGNAEAATLTERAIKFFCPRYVFFVGIAGGLKSELKLGDVVVADKVYAYESGKAEREFRTRPKAPLTAFESLQRAHATSRSGAWIKRIVPAPTDAPASFVKPIAAGEKIIDSHKSDAFRLIKKAYGDAYAVAMEEFGFYYALHANPKVVGAVVRGISDFSQKKATAEKEKSQEHASANAAAFAYEMLAGFLSNNAEDSADKLDYRHL